MGKYDFAKRLKRIVHEESKIVAMDIKIARKSSKHYNELALLDKMLAEQEQELSKYRKEVNKLKRYNKILEEFTQKQEENLCATILKVEQMQTEYQQTQKNQIDQRRTALLEMNCIRSLKQATQTYINLDALPHLIQGVTLCEKESSSEWKPFCVDPSNHTPKEVQDIIWHYSHDSINRETFEKLILCNISDETQKDMETESGNVTTVS